MKGIWKPKLASKPPLLKIERARRATGPVGRPQPAVSAENELEMSCFGGFLVIKRCVLAWIRHRNLGLHAPAGLVVVPCAGRSKAGAAMTIRPGLRRPVEARRLSSRPFPWLFAWFSDPKKPQRHDLSTKKGPHFTSCCCSATTACAVAASV